MRAGRTYWGKLLEDATERVQYSVSTIALGRNRGLIVGTGASGDKTLLADKKAEEELVRALLKVEGLKVLSEEAGERGDPRAKLLAIVDPLDGSSNFERGIPFYCTSVSIAEGSSLGDIAYGIVRNLVTGEVYSATRGGGATKNGKRIKTSRVKSPGKAVVGVDLSRTKASLVSGLARLVVSVNRQVHYGANVLELCYLAEGRIDAFVDMRERMRITDFAAGYLIAKEAGATITDPGGSELRPSFDLKERFSYVAAANAVLHKRILGLCQGADP